MSSIGTYDSFHNFAQRGVWAAGSSLYYDTLMTSSEDEVEVYYGLIAEKVEYPDDHSWIIFHLNPKARHQDGKPITADDVVFSFNKFFNEGVPQFKQYYESVAKAEALDARRVRFTLKEGDLQMLISLGGLSVLPRHWWESRKFSEPLTEIPLGSGAYTVKDYKMGQYIVYERLKNYWGMDLPVNKGQLNFDFLRYDYYRDETVALEAFKAGEYDFRDENVAKSWATLYTGPAFDGGTDREGGDPSRDPAGHAGLRVQHPAPGLPGPAGAHGAELRHGLRVDEQEPVLQPVHAHPQLLPEHQVRGHGTARQGGAEDPGTPAREDPRGGVHQRIQPAGHRRLGKHPGPGAGGAGYPEKGGVGDPGPEAHQREDRRAHGLRAAHLQPDHGAGGHPRAEEPGAPGHHHDHPHGGHHPVHEPPAGAGLRHDFGRLQRQVLPRQRPEDRLAFRLPGLHLQHRRGAGPGGGLPDRRHRGRTRRTRRRCWPGGAPWTAC